MAWKKLDVIWIGAILLIAGMFLIIFSKGMFNPTLCIGVGVIAFATGVFDIVVGMKKMPGGF